jgi:ATP-dependent helicase/nuclease subunit B
MNTSKTGNGQTPLRTRPRLYTIPPDVPFLPALARAMLRGDLPEAGGARPSPQALADWRIFLPSRRAARALAAALLEAAPAEAQILARIQPLGDVDEDELMLAELAAGNELLAELPPPVPPLVRRFLLARLVREWAEEDDTWPLARIIREHAGEALKLSQALAQLIDSFENEEIPFARIGDLLLHEQPEHRLAARDLLAHVRERWPALLRERGYMDAAARRARLIRELARRLKDDPPAAPVIAAGSTGTMPATAHLLATIARLPHGCVILPGLDTDMDDAAWEEIGEGHPQFGMKRLLEGMGAHRREVMLLPGIERDDHGQARTWLLSEVMRPAETTDEWVRTVAPQAERVRAGLRGVHLIRAETRRQEALAIALRMRKLLEEDGERTCALITPDRDLARQVRAMLARWRISVDDSAGRPLADLPPGLFLKLLADAALAGFAPEKLSALATHPLAAFGMNRQDFLHRFEQLQTAVLRHLPVFPGIAALPAAVAKRREEAQARPHFEHRAVRGLEPGDWDAMAETARRLADHLTPLARLFAERRPQPLGGLLRAFLEVAERVATDAEGICALWQEEAGEALAMAVSDLLAHAEAAPEMTARDMALFLREEMAAVPVRPVHASHSRLFILGLLEARLIPADVKILAGLNEGIWPPVAENDPFLNRPDRRALGLPVPERRLGLTAHDFVQAAANAEVWLTASDWVDQQPAVLSRWLLRLQAVMEAAGTGEERRAGAEVLEWAAWLDRPLLADGSLRPPRPVAPPRPCPPAMVRPARFSVTAVDRLRTDPYGFYAERILDLVPLPPLSCRITGRELGQIVHLALERFAAEWPAGKALPEDAAARLEEQLLKAFDETIDDQARRAWWAGRFARMAEWLVEQEKQWRESLERIHVELAGSLPLGFCVGERPAEISARADRIDVFPGGRVRLIDFKTGTSPAKRPASAGYTVQLDLEAWMLLKGAFEGVGKVKAIEEALYVRITGGEPAGEVVCLKPEKMDGSLEGRAERILGGVRRLIGGYADETQPYLPAGHGTAGGRPSDWAHLSRWQEWIHGLAGEDAGDDEEAPRQPAAPPEEGREEP